MSDWPRTETELAIEVVKYLEDSGWLVYKEVGLFGTGGDRADIVATKGPLVWVVECKTSMTLLLVGQAERWVKYANYVSVAVPASRSPNGLMQRILGWTGGIGALGVYAPGQFRYSVYEKIAPKLHRRTADGLRKALRPEYLTCEAGSSAPGWTPFKQTCANALQYVQREGGRVEYRAMLKALEHHYSSPTAARSSFIRGIEQGIVPGLRAEREVESGRIIVLLAER